MRRKMKYHCEEARACGATKQSRVVGADCFVTSPEQSSSH